MSALGHVMKDFCFLAGLVLIAFLLQGATMHVLAARAGSSSVDRALLSPPESMCILVMGDSHAMCAVEESHIPGALNLARPGVGYDIVYAELRDIFERQPDRWRAVILPLGYHSFSRDRITERGHDPHLLRLENTCLLAYRTGLWRPLGERLLREKLFPYAGILGRTSAVLDPRSRVDYLSEIHPLGMSSGRDVDQLVKGVMTTHFGAGVYWEDVLADYLERILGLCKKHDVAAVLVRFPVSDFYLEHIPDFIPVDEWEGRVRELLAHYPGAHLLDHRLMFRGHPECFVDADHVHKSYAPEFTRQLLRDLERLDLLCPRPGHKVSAVSVERGEGHEEQAA